MMHKHRAITLERLEKFVSPDNWTDINLRSQLYLSHAQVPAVLSVWSPEGLQRPTFHQALGRY